jgi:hypothetical protein
VGPYAIGAISDRTRSLSGGLAVAGLSLFVSATLVLLVPRKAGVLTKHRQMEQPSLTHRSLLEVFRATYRSHPDVRAIDSVAAFVAANCREDRTSIGQSPAYYPAVSPCAWQVQAIRPLERIDEAQVLFPYGHPIVVASGESAKHSRTTVASARRATETDRSMAHETREPHRDEPIDRL